MSTTDDTLSIRLLKSYEAEQLLIVSEIPYESTERCFCYKGGEDIIRPLCDQATLLNIPFCLITEKQDGTLAVKLSASWAGEPLKTSLYLSQGIIVGPIDQRTINARLCYETYFQ